MNSVRQTALAIACAFGMSGAAAAADSFGAIAFSPSTGANGYSWGAASKGAAEKRAMGECRKRARDCRIGISFWNSCGAVALGNGGGWGSAWATTGQRAQNLALDYCYQNTNNCRVIRWQCSIP